jgi:hypothetical protein
MPAGNFNPTLQINTTTGFVEWPAGPLIPADGESMVRVEVWVMQKTTRAIQMTYQTSFPGFPNTWTANQKWYPNQQYWNNGLFKPGAALGTAVAIATRNNVQSYYWWSEEVELV